MNFLSQIQVLNKSFRLIIRIAQLFKLPFKFKDSWQKVLD